MRTDRRRLTETALVFAALVFPTLATSGACTYDFDRQWREPSTSTAPAETTPAPDPDSTPTPDPDSTPTPPATPPAAPAPQPTGTWDCGQIEDCYLACPDDACADACYARGTAAARQRSDAVTLCLDTAESQQCQTICSQLDEAACADCIDGACAGAFDACYGP